MRTKRKRMKVRFGVANKNYVVQCADFSMHYSTFNRRWKHWSVILCSFYVLDDNTEHEVDKLNSKRVVLAGFCKFIAYGVFEMKFVIGVFSHLITVSALHMTVRCKARNIVPVSGHWPVHFSVCPANIVAYWTCMTCRFFYNKMRIRSGFFFSGKCWRLLWEQSLVECVVADILNSKRLLTFHSGKTRSSKPCKHCALSFKLNACGTELSSSLLPLLKTIVLSVTVQLLSIFMRSLCGDHLCMFCSRKRRWS